MDVECKVPVGHRVLHVSENPADSQLLQGQLDEELEGARVAHTRDPEGLAALARDFDLLVVDLPLPDVALETAVARVQSEQPRRKVLFRWNVGAAWHCADASEPMAGIVRQTLHPAPPLRERDPAEKERVLDRLVRGQELFLRLTQTDFWDFEEGLRTLTAGVARLLDVERVSVWELDPNRERLRCLDLYELSSDRHTQRMELGEFPRYLEALSASLMVAANDAREDPRTSEFREGYLDPLGITSMLDAPVRCRGVVRGVVCLEHVGPKRVWDVLEQCHAASAAALVSQALELRDRRRVEERLREAARLSAIGQLAARLAHDFDEHLRAIASALEGARAGHGAGWGAVEAGIARARESVGTLMGLRRERTRPAGPLALGAVLADLRPALERLAGEGVALDLEIAPEPLLVAIGHEEFEDVLVELVANARDAMPEGGSLRLTLRPGSAGSGRALLWVEDTGSGMDDATRARLFEPFFTTKDGARSSGMGLASVFAVVHAAGGALHVESQPGEGSCFLIELPLAG